MRSRVHVALAHAQRRHFLARVARLSLYFVCAPDLNKRKRLFQQSKGAPPNENVSAAASESCQPWFCSPPAPAWARPLSSSDDMGSVSASLTLSPTTSLNTASYSISGPNVFARSGTIDVSHSQTISFDRRRHPGGQRLQRRRSPARRPTARPPAAGRRCSRSPPKMTTRRHDQDPVPRAGRGPAASRSTAPSTSARSSTAIGANPGEVMVGFSSALSSSAHDSDGGPAPLTYAWVATSGHARRARRRRTRRCSARRPASRRVTLTVSDGDCTDTGTVSVICSPAPAAPALVRINEVESNGGIARRLGRAHQRRRHDRGSQRLDASATTTRRAHGAGDHPGGHDAAAGRLLRPQRGGQRRGPVRLRPRRRRLGASCPTRPTRSSIRTAGRRTRRSPTAAARMAPAPFGQTSSTKGAANDCGGGMGGAGGAARDDGARAGTTGAAARPARRARRAAARPAAARRARGGAGGLRRCPGRATTRSSPSTR